MSLSDSAAAGSRTLACLGSLTRLALIHRTALIISPVCCDVSTSSARHLGKCVFQDSARTQCVAVFAPRESFSSVAIKRLDGPSAVATASPGTKSKMRNYRPNQSVYHSVSITNLAMLMLLFASGAPAPHWQSHCPAKFSVI